MPLNLKYVSSSTGDNSVKVVKLTLADIRSCNVVKAFLQSRKCQNICIFNNFSVLPELLVFCVRYGFPFFPFPFRPVNVDIVQVGQSSSVYQVGGDLHRCTSLLSTMVYTRLTTLPLVTFKAKAKYGKLHSRDPSLSFSKMCLFPYSLIIFNPSPRRQVS